MRREVFLLAFSAALLVIALLLPAPQTQGHPFCEHDVCQTEESSRTGELRGICLHRNYYATNCIMNGSLCNMENCEPE